MHDFRRLEVWRRALALAIASERESRRFPRSDHGVIAAQLRRAALSIPANIAEGSVQPVPGACYVSRTEYFSGCPAP
ncbi:MAG: hypothetical protein DMD35_02280 [Gemmatimonadetes bacterium]|nr:MAG: hypothetical protein DMD35_02280 [Gemmatimonadota bacterium]